MIIEHYNGILEKYVLKLTGKADLRKTSASQEDNEPKVTDTINNDMILYHKIYRIEWRPNDKIKRITNHDNLLQYKKSC